MKTILSIISALLIPFSLFCQTDATIQEANRQLGDQVQPAFVTAVEGFSEKEIEKDWNRFVRDYDSKSRSDRDKNVEKAEKVAIPSLPDQPLDVYFSMADKGSDRWELVLWLSDEVGDFVSADRPDMASAAKNWIRKYLTKLEVTKKENLLKEMKKDVRTSKKDLRKANREVRKMEKSVEKLNEELAELQKELIEARGDIPKTEVQLEKRKSRVSALEAELEQLKAKN